MNLMAQRDAFWNKVYDLAWEDKDVMIVSADMGAPSLDKFRKDLSQQFVNAAIAEQNAVLISSGLALEGKKVFVYAIAPFLIYRCYEQIKLYLAGMNLPVTIVGVGAGFSYDDSGPTHHTVEDISMMRILPNMTIHNMTDSAMASEFANKSYGLKGPNYVRLDRKMLPLIYNEKNDFSSGVSLLRQGDDIAILATGNMVHRALEAADDLEKKHRISASVIDIYKIPINAEAFRNAIGDRRQLFTIEEHTLPGGFGSAVLEMIASGRIKSLVHCIGLNLSAGYCYQYGGRDNIQSLYGLDKESIVQTIIKELQT